MDKKEEAFTQLVREHKSTIYSVCYMFSKDTDEIDDLFQEILLRLWKGYDSFRAESEVRTWIYRVALNCCLNADKKKRRGRERVPLSMDIDPFEDTDDRALQTKRLYARINQLGLVDRAIILLWLEGLSYEEIGASMGISYFFAFVVLATIYMTSMNISTELMWRRGIFIAILCVGTLILEYVYAKRLLKSCDDIIDRLQMKEDNLQN